MFNIGNIQYNHLNCLLTIPITIVIAAAVVVAHRLILYLPAVQPAIHIIIIIHGGPGMAHNYMLTLKQLAYHRDCYGHPRDVYFYEQSGCGEYTTNWKNKC